MLPTTMPERPIDTRFAWQPFPVGSVVTFLDRDRRSVLGTVTELRRHQAIVAAGETGRWRVGYAGLQLVKAGPTGGMTMQQVVDHAAQLRERHLNTGAQATWWRFRFETATSRAGICRYTTRTIALSVSYVLRAPWNDIRDTLLHEVAHAIVGPGHAHDAVWQTAARRIGCTAKRCSTVTRSRKRWIGKCPRCRDPWFRQRLTAKVRQRSISPRCRSRIVWRINARERPLTAAPHEPT